MFKSTFPSVQHKAVKIGERLQTTMNNTAETQETRKSRINRFKKKEAQVNHPVNKALEQMITDISEAETMLIMILAQADGNQRYASNSMNAVQDIAIKVIKAIRPHVQSIVEVVNEYNSLTMEIANVAYFSVSKYLKFLPSIGATDIHIERLTTEQAHALLNIVEGAVDCMDCTPEAFQLIVKEMLSILSKIKMLAPRIIKIANAVGTLQNNLAEAFKTIKIDPYYQGNAFDQK